MHFQMCLPKPLKTQGLCIPPLPHWAARRPGFEVRNCLSLAQLYLITLSPEHLMYSGLPPCRKLWGIPVIFTAQLPGAAPAAVFPAAGAFKIHPCCQGSASSMGSKYRSELCGAGATKSPAVPPRGGALWSASSSAPHCTQALQTISCLSTMV